MSTKENFVQGVSVDVDKGEGERVANACPTVASTTAGVPCAGTGGGLTVVGASGKAMF